MVYYYGTAWSFGKGHGRRPGDSTNRYHGPKYTLDNFNIEHKWDDDEEAAFPNGVIDVYDGDDYDERYPIYQAETFRRVKQYIQKNPDFKFDVSIKWDARVQDEFSVEIPYIHDGDETDNMVFVFPLKEAYHQLRELLGDSKVFKMPTKGKCKIDYRCPRGFLSGADSQEMKTFLTKNILNCLYRPCMKPELKSELEKEAYKRAFSRVNRTLSKRGKPSLNADTQRHVLSFVGGRTRRSVSRQKGKGKSRRRSRSASGQ